MNQVEYPIDVRSLPPIVRHSTVFKTWDETPTSAAMVLISDHDPLPLYYQFACEYAGQFHWEYLQRGPEWHVRISKGEFPDPGFVPPKTKAPANSSTKTAAVSEPLVLDTRPMFARGESPCHAIDEAVDQLTPGQALVLLVPFEPVPLYAKLRNLGFSHTTTQTADGAWRVEFRK